MTAPAFTPVEMLAKLVSFDTTSSKTNLPLIEFVAEYLGAHGIACELVHNDDRTKANLLATLGPLVDGGIVLSGHTDVVPVEGQSWDADPFTLVERDGRLYGRGTADMKSFLAVALAMVPELLARGVKAPVHLAFSYDEEVGCLGAPRLVERLTAKGVRPKAVIVGEPTAMRVVNAHKAIRAFRTTVTGREAHSSATHLGANAIAAAAELITFLFSLGDELRKRGDPSGRFNPPHTTVSVGKIAGGTALNIIPKTCSFLWECRLLPGTEAGEIIARMDAKADEIVDGLRRGAPEAAIDTRPLGSVPPLEPEEDSAAESLALLLAQKNAAEAVSYGTEAGLFQRAGLSAIVCGPGDIAEAHRPNEFIETTQIDACVAFFRRMLDVLKSEA